MNKSVLVFMQYGVERMPLVTLNQLSEDAVFDGTFGKYDVYVVHNEAKFEQYAIVSC